MYSCIFKSEIGSFIKNIRKKKKFPLGKARGLSCQQRRRHHGV